MFVADKDKLSVSEAHGIWMEVVRITPEIASDWLEKKAKNRRIKTRHVGDLAGRIKDNKWKLNGQTIVFNRRGELIDGQQRLTAVTLTGLPITSCVIFGIDDAAFDSMDSGSKRSPGDVAYIMGEKNEKSVAGALRILKGYDQTPRASSYESGFLRISNDEVVELLSRYPGIGESVEYVRRSKNESICEPSTLGACHYIFKRINSPLADTYVGRILDGDSVQKGEAAHYVRERLIQSRITKTNRMRKSYVIALIIKGWNAYREGRTVTLLRWTDDEPFPAAK